MKCASSNCKEQAKYLMKYKVKNRGLLNFYFCKKCADAKTERLNGKKINYIIGECCPFCLLGFVKQWAHRDHGRCYRCNGSAFWSNSKKLVTFTEKD